MEREITSFPFPPAIRNKLLKCGLKTRKQVEDLKSALRLAKETGLSNEEALMVLKTIKSEDFQPTDAFKSQGVSALELLKAEQKTPIITFCREIDEMLGGGIQTGKITEICGSPGVGKTQFGMQLAVNVSIPKDFIGVEGKCIYIDTEGSFIFERVVEIAEALVAHLEKISPLETASQPNKETPEKLTVESILSNIHYYRIHDHVEQLALVTLLPSLIEELKNVRLIVIDSVTFHFRYDFEDFGLRTRVLNQMALNLLSLAEKHDIAIVLMNHVTTRGQDQQIVPALGESWGHTCTIRLLLYCAEGKRLAHLQKSPSHKNATVPYDVTERGVRDTKTKRTREEN